MNRSVVLLLAVALSSAAAPAQQAQGTPRVAAVNSIAQYRVVWMEDTTQFDACKAFRAMGQPADFAASLSRQARRVITASDTPCSRQTAAAPPGQSRVVMLDSLVLGDTTGQAFVHVRKGERSHREVYELRAYSGGWGWGISSVKLLAGVRITPGRQPPAIPPRP